LAELERDKRISEEYQRIKRFFEKLGEKEKSLVLPLIQNAAFMRIALEDLQEIISEQGPVEAYQNGQNQYGMKQSAALQAYNTTVKNYAGVISKLYGLLPADERPQPPQWEYQEKAGADPEEESLQDEERRESTNREIALAVEFQKWQREQEQAGKTVTVSFETWKSRCKGGEET